MDVPNETAVNREPKIFNMLQNEEISINQYRIHATTDANLTIQGILKELCTSTYYIVKSIATKSF